MSETAPTHIRSKEPATYVEDIDKSQYLADIESPNREMAIRNKALSKAALKALNEHPNLLHWQKGMAGVHAENASKFERIANWESDIAGVDYDIAKSVHDATAQYIEESKGAYNLPFEQLTAEELEYRITEAKFYRSFITSRNLSELDFKKDSAITTLAQDLFTFVKADLNEDEWQKLVKAEAVRLKAALRAYIKNQEK